jgi:hypothetical protein
MEFNESIVFSGGINTDDTPQGMPKGDYRDLAYCRIGYNTGNGYSVETSAGTTLILNSSIGVEDQIMGATVWQKQNAIVYFVFKATGIHEIWLYYIDTQVHDFVLASSELNFSREWPIYHANVIDDILKWTDGRWDPQMYDADGNRLFNPPYQINIQKALDNYYTDGYTLQVLDAIKWPMEPPYTEFITDYTRNDNKLRRKLFKFIVQPIYENGESGVWSMYSNLALPTQSELITGTNFVNLNNDNCVRVSFNTGPKVIRKINVAVQEWDQTTGGAASPYGIFLELDKTIDGIADNDYYTISFYGDAAVRVVADALVNYDRLPITANCQEYLPTNQLVYANFREGYDKIPIDVSVQYNLKEIDWNPFQAVDFQLVYLGASSEIRTDSSDFNAINVFPFEAGMVFWGPAPTSAGFGQLYYQLSSRDIQDAMDAGPAPMAMNVVIMQIIGDAFMNQLGYALGTANPAGTAVIYDFASGPNINGVSAPRVRSTRQTFPQPSLKVGATHEFGIVYGDRAYRDGTVLTGDSMSLFVPWFYDINRTGLNNSENPFTVNPSITINHQPPVWADRYWIVSKPATEILSFGQYTVTSAANADGSNYNSAVTFESTTNRYKIQIDNYYSSQNQGAAIQHQIQVGDRVRFIRQRPDGNQTDATYTEYLPYLELEVLEYDPVGGTADENRPNRQAIYVTIFNEGSIEADFTASLGNLFGQLIEIYTPRKAVDDNNGLFISEWRDITPAMPIVNAHTEDRSHGIVFDSYRIYYKNIEGTWYRYMWGDQTSLIGTTWDYELFATTYSRGTVTINNANYSTEENITYLVLSLPGITGSTMWYWNLTNNQEQIYSGGVQTQAAIINPLYGDVYVKQRNYGTGLVAGSRVYMYWVEDPHYSDYWLSDVHQTGRFRVQDPKGKMVNKNAVAIHSDSYVFGTDINGLSSFSLLGTNVQELNPIYGQIVRIYNSGREGKTLKCIQEKKENSIYIQFYPNEVGSDSTVRVSNKTFASWFDYRTMFGCTNPGATAILPNGDTMYFDNNAGVFIYSAGNGQLVVSEIDPETNKDFKFRSKTKALAAAYNASSNPLVRTYVNESVGEVGFAFRFDSPYTGTAEGRYNPPSITQEVWTTGTFDDISYLYGRSIVIVHENGAVYSGVVNFIGTQDTGPAYSVFSLDTGGPEISEYRVPAYYYTTSGMPYEHVVFDYVNKRWRSTYDYNFQQFCNLGQTLVGWGVDNQLYLHNQDSSFEFHGSPFTQEVSFVSNEQPFMLKRYQNIALVSDDIFSVTAYSEPNRSYPLGMRTTIPSNLFSTYEGYGKANYRKNLYDSKFFNDANVAITSYNPPFDVTNGWTMIGDYSYLLGEIITIIQSDGNIYTGEVNLAAYDLGLNQTSVTLLGIFPGTTGITGNWYFSERPLTNGEDIRANALTHVLQYNPSVTGQSAILFAVGIKGVLS